jgi:methyl-accepting chemotaxis protein
MFTKKFALNPQHWSIRNKIVGIVALVVIVTTISLAVNNYFTVTELSHKQAVVALQEYGAQLVNGSLGKLQKNVENLITLSLSPSLIDAVQKANERYSGLEGTQIDEEIASRDKAWKENDSTVEELIKGIMENQNSYYLRSFQQTFPDEVEVFLTDERGLILAMTERTSDYLQADEEWWKQTYRGGQGSVYVSEVVYDESTKTWAVDIGIPIRSETGENVIGVLRGTVDITAMFSGLNVLAEEKGIHTLVIGKDGKIVYSENVDDLMQQAPDQFTALINQAHAGWSLNLKAANGEPIRLAYVPMSGEYADNLGWTFILYVHQGDVDTMMNQAVQRAFIVSAIVLLLLIIVGIFLGTNLTKPFSLMTDTARRLATGDVALSGIDRKKVVSNLARRDEIGETTRAFSELIDYMRALANSAQHIAVGDISVAVLSKGEHDLLGTAFQRMVIYLEEIAHVADQLSLGVVNIDIVPQSENDVLRNAFVRMVDYQLEMLSAAKLMAMGDLSLILKPHSEDDAQGNAYVQMIDILRDIVGQVKRGAEHLGVSSVELSQVATQSSQASAQIAMTVGQVASGINQENESVNKTVVSVDQMSRAIDSVAKGALEQANSIENVSSAINELTFAIKDIHRGAMEQAEQMQRASSARGSMSQAIENVVKATEAVGVESDRSAAAARDGAALASRGILGMEQVREATEELAKRVFDLGQRSSQIGAIVETIADIASTTNLLALNAAIEAARAGEHGKGFAVVADEVRKLAERSATATQEISEMIRVIQAGVNNAVETMQKAGKDVRSAVDLTNQESQAFETIAAGTQVSAEGIETIHTALQAMQTAEEQLLKAIRDASAVAERNRQASEAMDEMNNQVVAGLESVSAIVEENTAATQVMTSISNEVSQAIEDIAATSEENSASIEEVAAAAEQLNAQIEEVTASAGELSDMARGLQEAVAQFNLGEEEQTLLQENLG